MVAIVDREGCIGCTLCTGVCPEVFQMEDGLPGRAGAYRAGKRRRRCSGQLPGVGHPAGVTPKTAQKSGAVPDGERRRF